MAKALSLSLSLCLCIKHYSDIILYYSVAPYHIFSLHTPASQIIHGPRRHLVHIPETLRCVNHVRHMPSARAQQRHTINQGTHYAIWCVCICFYAYCLSVDT